MRKNSQNIVTAARKEFTRIMEKWGCYKIEDDYYIFRGIFGIKYINLWVDFSSNNKFDIVSGAKDFEKNCLKYAKYNFHGIIIEQFEETIEKIIKQPLVYYNDNGYKATPEKSKMKLAEYLEKNIITENPIIYNF